MPACGGFALSCLWPWAESRPQEHGLHGGPASNGRCGREVEKQQGSTLQGDVPALACLSLTGSLAL
jgi:hypothetical protein